MRCGMLSEEGKSIITNTSSLEDGTVVMKSGEGLIQLTEGCFIEHITPRKVTELKECTEGANYILGNIPFNCWEIYLVKMYQKNKNVTYILLTFISAFESSPVHCLNPRP